MGGHSDKTDGIFIERLRESPEYVQKSLLCGVVGFATFFVALSSLAEHHLAYKMYEAFNQSIAETYKESRRRAWYQAKANIIPFVEVSIVMPAVFLVVCYFPKLAPGFQSALRQNLYCLGVCFAMMFTICFALRLSGLRKDCPCGTFELPLYAENRQFIIAKENAAAKKDRQKNETKEGIELCNKNRSKLRDLLINLVALPLRILEVPFFLALATFTVLQCVIALPFAVVKANCKQNFSWEKDDLHKSYFEAKCWLYAAIHNVFIVASLGLLEPLLRARAKYSHETSNKQLRIDVACLKEQVAVFQGEHSDCTTLIVELQRQIDDLCKRVSNLQNNQNFTTSTSYLELPEEIGSSIYIQVQPRRNSI